MRIKDMKPGRVYWQSKSNGTYDIFWKTATGAVRRTNRKSEDEARDWAANKQHELDRQKEEGEHVGAIPFGDSVQAHDGTSGSAWLELLWAGSILVANNPTDEDQQRALKSVASAATAARNFLPAHALLGSDDNFVKKAWYQMSGIFRKERLSVYDSVETNVKKFMEYVPDIFVGYPSIFILMANYITQNNLKTSPPKKIFTTAEVLFDADRARIKAVFGCDVIDMYGCTELRRLAWECPMHEGYHTDIDCAVVEIVKDDILDTEDGNIVVTGLHNYAMPLIRYQTGDIARSSQHTCSCGRVFPLIKHIKGRTDDMVILPSGTIISPRCINILDYIEGIDRYRDYSGGKGAIS